MILNHNNTTITTNNTNTNKFNTGIQIKNEIKYNKIEYTQ